MKPLPSEILVGSILAKVRMVDHPTLDDGCATHATYDNEQKVIEVKKGLARQAQWLAFLHEMMHQAVDSADADVDLAEWLGVDKADRIEHMFIRAMCSEFLGALRREGWLKFPGE